MATRSRKSVVPDEKTIAFFREHAGFSYDPKVETEEQGKERCAAEYATADVRIRKLIDQFKYRFRWVPDLDAKASDYDPDIFPKGQQFWGCVMEKRIGRYSWDCVQSLWAIDVTHPAPYARVIEAELALEELD